ncbi:hypothetical protein AVEN_205442-1, partial [Araneus ventricosus]
MALVKAKLSGRKAAMTRELFTQAKSLIMIGRVESYYDPGATFPRYATAPSKTDPSWGKLPLPQGVGLLPFGSRKVFHFPSTTYWIQQRHSPIYHLLDPAEVFPDLPPTGCSRGIPRSTTYWIQ